MAQLWTLLWLRYRLSLSRLRTQASQPWLTGLVIGFLALVSLFLGTATGWGVYLLLSKKQAVGDYVDVILWAVLWFQVFFSVVGQTTGTSASFDPRRFLLFPIALQKLFVVNFGAVYADLSCWFLLPTVLGAVLTPAFFAHQTVWGLVLALLGVLWLGVVSFTVNLGLARLLSRGGLRGEILTAVAIGAAVVLPQVFLLLGVKFPGWGADLLRLLKPWLGLRHFFPPGALGAAVAGWPIACTAVLLWCGLLLWLDYHWFRALALRVEGGTPPLRPSGRGVLPEVWWGLSPQVSTLLNKQLRYIGRNPLSYFLLLPTGVLFAWGGVVSQRGWSGLWALLGVSTVFLFSAQLYNNTFGFDSHGFKTYLLAPIGWHKVLFAHNLGHGLWVALQVLLGLGLVQLLGGGLEIQALFSTLIALGILGVSYSLVGNWVSIRYPLRLEFGVQSRRNGNPLLLLLTPLLALGVNLIVLLPLVLLTLLAHLLGNWLVLNGGLLLYLGLALVIYPRALQAQSRDLSARQYQVLDQLIKVR
ncbi:hypothetical protein [Anthocerotibacter panamensis]|uniref:hypothetical protein n=1 Tax=Anthocerotibacter panamensis TaxID=2857077 RepID=UPI001C407D9B|nr:hypothetical protein [Anthocerotibacter panamensis]